MVATSASCSVQKKCAGSIQFEERKVQDAGWRADVQRARKNGDVISYLKSNPTEYIKVLKLL